MKKIIYKIVLTICCLSLMIIPCLSTSQEGYPLSKKDLIGEETAKNNVLSFINSNSHVGVSINKVADSTNDSFISTSIVKIPSKVEYVFETNNSIYKVNALTGQVDSAIYFSPISGKINYTLNQGEEIARKYASQLYPGFADKNFKLYDQSSINYSESLVYSYSWCEYIENARTPNYISIMINSVSGELVSFNFTNIPYIIKDISPKISQEQAVSLIKAKYSYLTKITEISPALVVEYMDYGKQMLVWEISIKGEMGTGTWISGIWNTEYVDALTGAILPPPPTTILNDIAE